MWLGVGLDLWVVGVAIPPISLAFSGYKQVLEAAGFVLPYFNDAH